MGLGEGQHLPRGMKTSPTIIPPPRHSHGPTGSHATDFRLKSVRSTGVVRKRQARMPRALL
ncbi:hypothetical protein OE88DRAFT_1651867 [Heliocybe sulcata]|uniref:Uncharacterized protein n=1 Tax=Heliocybe sulcata TaxID=5364 RepID=A0A5C3NEX2_9AGAM|nr:hypothetical protein OE88DRAFT_1651867 [Heliocybe sulcata]